MSGEPLPVKIRFVKNWSKQSFDIWFVWDHERHWDWKLTFTRSEEPVHEPSRRHQQRDADASIPMREFSQLLPALLEGLAEAGFLAAKPGDIAHVESLKYHLEDMRALVFKDQVVLEEKKNAKL